MSEFGDKGDGITRRDFLDGVAITAAGLAAAAAAPHLSGGRGPCRLARATTRNRSRRATTRRPSPASRASRTSSCATRCASTGRRTSATSTSTEGGPGIHVRRVVDSDETYDCVIVGAGASGLAAAKYYRDQLRRVADPAARPAARLRWALRTATSSTSGATTFLKHGGAGELRHPTAVWNKPTGGLLDIPGSYGQPAVDLLAYLGVEAGHLPEDLTAPGLRTARDAAVPGQKLGERTR